MFIPEGVAEGLVSGLEAYQINKSREASADYNKRMMDMQEAKFKEGQEGAEKGGKYNLEFLTSLGLNPDQVTAPANAPDGSGPPPPLINPPAPQPGGASGPAAAPMMSGVSNLAPGQTAFPSPAPGAQAMAPGQSSAPPPQQQAGPVAPQQQKPPPEKLPGQAQNPGMDILSYAKWFKATYPQASGKDFMYGLNAMMPVFDQRSKMIAEDLKYRTEVRKEAEDKIRDKQAQQRHEETVRKDDLRHEEAMAREKLNQQNQNRLSMLALQTIKHQNDMTEIAWSKDENAKEALKAKKEKEDADKKLYETTDAVKLNNANMYFSGGKPSENSTSRGKEGAKLDLEAKEKMFEYLHEKGYETEQITRFRNENTYKLPALKANIINLQKREGMVAEGTKEFKYDYKTLDSVLDQVGNKWPEALAQPINYLKGKLSDSDLGILKLGTEQVGTKYERVLSGGGQSAAQMHTATKEQAHAIAHENMTVEQIRAKVPMMYQELDNADAAYQKQLEEALDKIPDITKLPNNYPPGTAFVGKNPSDGYWEFRDKDKNILKRIK
jgi:hypothetical protein